MLVTLKITGSLGDPFSMDVDWCPCCDAMFGDSHNQYIWASEGIEDYIEECNLCGASFSLFEEGLGEFYARE